MEIVSLMFFFLQKKTYFQTYPLVCSFPLTWGKVCGCILLAENCDSKPF